MENKSPEILVVDDEPDLCETICDTLMLMGFSVDAANSGNQAIKKLQSKNFDLVLSDVRMPDGDGLSLLDNIRKVDPKVPVLIFMTGYSDVSPQECIDRGAMTVISKPFSNEEIVQAIKKALPQFKISN